LISVQLLKELIIEYIYLKVSKCGFLPRGRDEYHGFDGFYSSIKSGATLSGVKVFNNLCDKNLKRLFCLNAMLFSHDVIRPSQKELVETVKVALEHKKHMLAHAPTGLGKTAAVLCPALDFASKKNLTVFFLTSRHTQHKIVLETVKKLNEKNNTNVTCASLIGKKWMCAQDVENFPSSDFTEYCKSLVENDQLSLAIGRGGQNVRLAAQLSGWKLNVRDAENPDGERKQVSDSEELSEKEEVVADAEVSVAEIAQTSTEEQEVTEESVEELPEEVPHEGSEEEVSEEKEG